MPTVPFLDLSGVTDEVREAVEAGWADVVASRRFVGGPVVEEFERAWAAYCGCAEAIGVANGTDALVLALRAAGITSGDEVIVPANTFVATAEAVVLCGAVPRFADVDPETLLLTGDHVRSAVTDRTRAVIVVHLYGQVADMTDICAAADAAGMVIIEDAAQAHGGSWRGRPAGSFGRAACFSFYPGKNLGAFGDAGAIVTNDATLARRARILRDHGRRPGSHYDHSAVGTNSRLDAVQAVVLSAKLPHLDRWNQRRAHVVQRYDAALVGTPFSSVQTAAGAVSAHHLAVIRVQERDRVRAELAERGIESSIHYPIPCHQLEPYAQYQHEALPVAEAAAGEILSLRCIRTSPTSRLTG
jgi:dTDP-4-amino-4,6-dideoxygalactose transaminase